MTKFEEEFNYLIELSGKVLIGQVDAEAFEKNRIAFFEKYETDQQQALPVVPECVAEFVSGDENELSKADRIAYLLKSVQGDSYYLTEELPGGGTITVDEGQELYNWAICQHHETILELWNGYTVEKPQLFEVKMPIVYWDDDASQLTNGFDFLRIDKETDEVDFIGFLSNTKKHTVYFTEQEIKSIDERYWQFAVPVEDGE